MAREARSRRPRGRRAGTLAATLATVALGCFGTAAASAGTWERFSECPLNNPETGLCVYAHSQAKTLGWEHPVEPSELVAGLATIPLSKPIVLQGGVRQTVLNQEEEMIAPEGGYATLKPIRQPIPGGLRAVVDPTKLSGDALATYRTDAKKLEDNKVWAVIEAAPYSPIVHMTALNILEGAGTGIELPLKVHFEGAFLGSECYAGSDTSPVVVQLTTATTNPPSPGTPVTGQPGRLSEGGRSEWIEIKEDSLVSNSFAAPAVEGCGTEAAWHEEVDAAINSKVGLPSPPGTNITRIDGTLYMAPVSYVKRHLGL